MPESLYSLVLLACPIGMGLMMWFMMKGKKAQEPASADESEPSSARIARLQAEVDQLKSELRDSPHPPVRPNAHIEPRS